mmetsp:Transcript_12264/g.34356  ORF Transcript_12264/g.34356 Transcript_12264/m.34356 type:complete len:101 (-) Transcript_12264:91-393(-)
MDFGRVQQGCPECGGCVQNIRGACVQGSGKCYTCDGVGTVTPKVDEKRRFRTVRSKLFIARMAPGSEFGTGSESVGSPVTSPMAAENSTGSVGFRLTALS